MQKKTRSFKREWTQPSIPPASPHRAGHYSGLHPEDQPYQSNKISVQYPTSQESESWRTSLPEPEHIILPVTDPVVQRRIAIPEYYDERSVEELPTLEKPFFYEPGRWLLPRRVIPVLLMISCIFFLLASSIIIVVLIRKSAPAPGAHMSVSPSSLSTNNILILNGTGFRAHSVVTFTYDVNRMILDENKRPLAVQTGDQGTFSIQLRVPNDWKPGQYSIHATDASDRLSVSTTVIIEQSPMASL